MKYITTKQTAEKLGVSISTIQRLVKSKKIPFTRAMGKVRFPEDTIDEWARSPAEVLARWFEGKKVEKCNGIEEGQNLGRALFLSGQQG